MNTIKYEIINMERRHFEKCVFSLALQVTRSVQKIFDRKFVKLNPPSCKTISYYKFLILETLPVLNVTSRRQASGLMAYIAISNAVWTTFVYSTYCTFANVLYNNTCCLVYLLCVTQVFMLFKVQFFSKGELKFFVSSDDCKMSQE